MNRAFQLLLLAALITSGCGGARLSNDEIRRQIAELGTSTLVPESVNVRRVVSRSGTSAIAETTVELAFQFERDTAGSPWRITSVRLGDQNWVSVPELLTAVNETRRNETIASFRKLAAGLAAYQERNGAAPNASTIQALADILHPQYMSDLVLDDAWGHQIEVDTPGPDFRFRSLGPDGQRGTADDILSSE